jgi:carbohydrate diacid regulator
MDPEGRETAVTAPVFAEASAFVPKFAQSPADSQSWGEFEFFKIFDEQVPEFVLVIRGGGDNSLIIGKMAAFQITGLLAASKERYDHDSFIKNLLLDNLLLVDIYRRAKKLHIAVEAPRVVLIIETGGSKDFNVLEYMQQYIGTGTTDFVTAVDENNVVVVKDLSEALHTRDVAKTAEAIAQYLRGTGMQKVHIAYGTAVDEIKDVSRSYKEAKMALDVGKIFFEDMDIVAYSQLGIERLIYQLPIPLCKMFIREIFGGRNPDDFDEETLITINKFFENNLNVSETSRQLFIHRNTLVYRLDKLQKSTGLDLRVFDDAITFKIALMVVKYMKYMESLQDFEY